MMLLTCDVAIVGGGPAGSTCAWKLRQAGARVAIIDAARFPRVKPCAGWITPGVIEQLGLDVDEYRRDRTFQAIAAFRTGVIGRRATVATGYAWPVSYGIRRVEFDDYLLTRSGARRLLGAPVTAIRQNGRNWVLNEQVQAPMLVGAGGHFCPVARHLNTPTSIGSGTPLVTAQQAEWEVGAADTGGTEPGVPEIYFCEDLQGYGWSIRNGSHINVGLGRVGRQAVPAAVRQFLEFLERRRRIAPHADTRWRGHAYLLRDDVHRRVVADGVLLAGDAAGLAEPHSGEGIRAAVASGLAAAAAIIDAHGRYSDDRLAQYAATIFAGVEAGLAGRAVARVARSGVGSPVGRTLLELPCFVRRVVLDRWFLGAAEGNGRMFRRDAVS